MRWLCAPWLRFRSAEGFGYRLSGGVCTSNPELHCPALAFLILLSFSLYNPFLSALGGAH